MSDATKEIVRRLPSSFSFPAKLDRACEGHLAYALSPALDRLAILTRPVMTRKPDFHYASGSVLLWSLDPAKPTMRLFSHAIMLAPDSQHRSTDPKIWFSRDGRHLF